MKYMTEDFLRIIDDEVRRNGVFCISTNEDQMTVHVDGSQISEVRLPYVEAYYKELKVLLKLIPEVNDRELLPGIQAKMLRMGNDAVDQYYKDMFYGKLPYEGETEEIQTIPIMK